MSISKAEVLSRYARALRKEPRLLTYVDALLENSPARGIERIDLLITAVTMPLESFPNKDTNSVDGEQYNHDQFSLKDQAFSPKEQQKFDEMLAQIMSGFTR